MKLRDLENEALEITTWQGLQIEGINVSIHDIRALDEREKEELINKVRQTHKTICGIPYNSLLTENKHCLSKYRLDVYCKLISQEMKLDQDEIFKKHQVRMKGIMLGADELGKDMELWYYLLVKGQYNGDFYSFCLLDNTIKSTLKEKSNFKHTSYIIEGEEEYLWSWFAGEVHSRPLIDFCEKLYHLIKIHKKTVESDKEQTAFANNMDYWIQVLLRFLMHESTSALRCVDEELESIEEKQQESASLKP